MQLDDLLGPIAVQNALDAVVQQIGENAAQVSAFYRQLGGQLRADGQRNARLPAKPGLVREYRIHQKIAGEPGTYPGAHITL